MRKISMVTGLVALTALAACFDSDTERGLVGAASGAVIASTTGGNALAGALIGGAAGVVCDDLGVCKNR
jgi:hypothetical protein